MSKVAKNKTFNQQIVTKLDVMKIQNEHFETNELSRSNKTLYSLLGQVYEVFNSVDSVRLISLTNCGLVIAAKTLNLSRNAPLSSLRMICSSRGC